MSETNLCNCSRCGKLCRASGPKHPDARLLRRSAVPKGHCANCAITQFLKGTEATASLLMQNGPQVLLAPHIQEQFAAILRAGNADAEPGEIDWCQVAANWQLPVIGEVRGRTLGTPDL